MRVLVIGGGIGGMASAIALEQAGLDPYVVEQSPEWTEIGSGIGMHANAMRVLTRLGAADFVRRSGARIDSGEWRRLDNGRPIFSQEFTSMADRYGDVYICMHRADLLESLVQRVPPERVRLNARLVGLEERPDGVVARLESGEEVVGDVLVAPTACGRPSGPYCSASRRPGSPAWPPGGASSPQTGCRRGSRTGS
jgi:salicylate hydroxylase